MREAQKDVQDSVAASNAIAQRLLGNIRTLRALGCEAVVRPRYESAVRRAKDRAVDVGLASAVFGAVVHFAANCSLLVVLAVGGEQVMRGALSPGSLSSGPHTGAFTFPTLVEPDHMSVSRKTHPPFERPSERDEHRGDPK